MLAMSDLDALRACQTRTDTYLAVVFPIAYARLAEIETILSRHTQILSRSSLALDRNGLHNLEVQIYRHEPWLGPAARNHPGVSAHVAARASGDLPTTVYLLAADDLQHVKQAKQQARDLLGMDNVPLHTSDTREETVRVAEQVFGPYGVEFLNLGHPRRFARFRDFFAAYRDWIATTGLPAGDFCVVGSAVLAAYGLRPCRDWDFVSRHDVVPGPPGIARSEGDLEAAGLSLEAVLGDPALTFTYDGYRFLSLPSLRLVKVARGAAKDLEDVTLIDGAGRSARPHSLAQTRQRIRMWPSAGRHLLGRRIPRGLRARIRGSFRRAAHMDVHARATFDRIAPRDRVVTYRGIRIFSRRGSRSMVRLGREGVAAPALVRQLTPLMAQHGWKRFVLVGAEEGLLALQLVTTRPSVTVTCLEGRREYAPYLRQTIEGSGLGDRISLVSGDISVDDWWDGAGRPEVQVVIWNRRGHPLRWGDEMTRLIQACRPHLFVTGRADPDPAEAERLWDGLQGHGYDVLSLNLIRQSPTSFGTTFRRAFYAVPRAITPRVKSSTADGADAARGG